MSGLPELQGLQKECCVATLAIREWRVARGKEQRSIRFGCHVCGRSYRWSDEIGWQPVRPLADLEDMVANDPRGHLSTEEQKP